LEEGLGIIVKGGAALPAAQRGGGPASKEDVRLPDERTGMEKRGAGSSKRKPSIPNSRLGKQIANDTRNSPGGNGGDAQGACLVLSPFRSAAGQRKRKRRKKGTDAGGEGRGLPALKLLG